MVNCTICESEREIYYICQCESGFELICSEHLQSHLSTPGQHKIIQVSQDSYPETCSYLLSALQNNIENLHVFKTNIENYSKSLQVWIKSADSILNQINEVSDYCKSYINYLQDKMKLPVEHQVKENLATYAMNNFTMLTRIPLNQIENVFKSLDFKLELQPIPKISLNCYSDFFETIQKLSRPVIQSSDALVQIDPSYFFHCKNNLKAELVKSFEAKYKNCDYTIKVCEDSESNTNQLDSHMNNSKEKQEFLRVVLYFKAKSQLMIITEKYSHTLFNEVFSRSFENCQLKPEKIEQVFRLLLETLVEEKECRHITPNMLHVTESGDYKIWYPHSLSASYSADTYLSPEYEALKSGKKDYSDKINPKAHNLYGIGLVVLHIATLKDTSMMYKEENKNNLVECLMTLKESPLRKSLIGILIKSIKLRLTFEKVNEILKSSS